MLRIKIDYTSLAAQQNCFSVVIVTVFILGGQPGGYPTQPAYPTQAAYPTQGGAYPTQPTAPPAGVRPGEQPPPYTPQQPAGAAPPGPPQYSYPAPQGMCTHSAQIRITAS